MKWHLKKGAIEDRHELRDDSGKVLATVYQGMLGWTVQIDSTMSPGFPSEKQAKAWAKRKVNQK